MELSSASMQSRTRMKSQRAAHGWLHHSRYQFNPRHLTAHTWKRRELSHDITVFYPIPVELIG
jgi:hypothetical protein